MWARSAVVGTVMLTAAAFLSACSSSKPAATGATTTSTAVAGTDPTTASAAGTSLASEVTNYEAVPTSIPITTPLATTPPKGKTFVFLQCDVAQCTQESTALRAVTTAIGWNLKVIPFQSANPATLIAGLQQALLDDPAAVGLTGIPEVEWQSVVPAYQKAGVPIVVGDVGPQTLNSTVIANIVDDVNVQMTAQALADYFVVNSDGKGDILQFQVPDFPILDAFDVDFRTDVQAACPGCSITQLNATIAEVTSGGSTAAIVSGLQRNPQDTWVVTDDGPWVDGLPAAAAAAGLHPKIIGEGADTTDETDIKAGTMTAFTALAINYEMWATMDAVLRHIEGMPIPASDGLLPLQLLVQGENFTVSESYDQPANYATQMENLWHVGS